MRLFVHWPFGVGFVLCNSGGGVTMNHIWIVAFDRGPGTWQPDERRPIALILPGDGLLRLVMVS